MSFLSGIFLVWNGDVVNYVISGPDFESMDLPLIGNIDYWHSRSITLLNTNQKDTIFIYRAFTAGYAAHPFPLIPLKPISE